MSAAATGEASGSPLKILPSSIRAPTSAPCRSRAARPATDSLSIFTPDLCPAINLVPFSPSRHGGEDASTILGAATTGDRERLRTATGRPQRRNDTNQASLG